MYVYIYACAARRRGEEVKGGGTIFPRAGIRTTIPFADKAARASRGFSSAMQRRLALCADTKAEREPRALADKLNLFVTFIFLIIYPYSRSRREVESRR